MGKANGSRECAPDDRLRVPTVRISVADRWWARRCRAFAHPTALHSQNGDAASHSRGRICPGFASHRAPRKLEGAGNAGCRPHPWPACNKKRRRQLPQVQPEQPASPAQWITAYTWSPRCTGLVSHRRSQDRPASLIPASGDQDNTTSLVRSEHHSSVDAKASIASRTSFRDDRDTPSLWARDGRTKATDLPDDTSADACDRITRRAVCARPTCANWSSCRICNKACAA